MRQDNQTDQDTYFFIAYKTSLKYYNSATWDFLCSAWILKGLNLDVNSFTSHLPRLSVNIKTLTVKNLLILIYINIKKFSQSIQQTGVWVMWKICAEPCPYPLPAQAKGRPAARTGISLLARSKLVSVELFGKKDKWRTVFSLQIWQQLPKSPQSV